MSARAVLLAAGRGTRLRPYTCVLPKCLMPIRGRPLLEYWLASLRSAGVEAVLVNLHHHAEAVRGFLAQPAYAGWVVPVHEPTLLGTAGTLKRHRAWLGDRPAFVAHADNLCCGDLSAFLRFHADERPRATAMTMMTFRTDTPRSCGIVELDEAGVVVAFHEKAADPPGNLANAAVYVLEPEVLDFLAALPGETLDLSTQVIPSFVGRIATFENRVYNRDIGTPESLLAAQEEARALLPRLGEARAWHREYARLLSREIPELVAELEVRNG